MEWRSEKPTSTTTITVAIIGKYKETYMGKYYQQIHPRKVMWIYGNYHSQLQSELSVTKADWPKYSLRGNSWCFSSLNEELIQAPFRKKGSLELLTFLLLFAIIRNVIVTSWKMIKIIAFFCSPPSTAIAGCLLPYVSWCVMLWICFAREEARLSIIGPFPCHSGFLLNLVTLHGL